MKSEWAEPYSKVLYFEYNPHENAFYDQAGKRLDSILEMITPNDLYLFRQDHGNCCFPHRKDNDILCEIDAIE